jgi:hypothetical protein
MYPTAARTGPPGYQQNGAKACPRKGQNRSSSDRHKKWRLRFVEPTSGRWQWQVGNGRLWEQDEGSGEKDDMDQDQRRVLSGDCIREGY